MIEFASLRRASDQRLPSRRPLGNVGFGCQETCPAVGVNWAQINPFS
jgi:hypothetical protein